MAKANLLKMKVGEHVYLGSAFFSGLDVDRTVYKLSKVSKDKVTKMDMYVYQMVAPKEMQKSPRLYKDHKHIKDLRNLDRVKVIKDYKDVPAAKRSRQADHPEFKESDWFNEVRSAIYDVACVTTNSSISPKGNAVMGRGLAKAVAEAAMKKQVNIKRILGAKLQEGTYIREGAPSKKMTTKFKIYQTRVRALTTLTFGKQETIIAALPVKQGWWEHARMSIIETSLKQLVKIADDQGYNKVLLNFPGIGAGKLGGRVLDIKKILCRVLDSRFTVVTLPRKES